ncbi:MAG: DUF6011 domain-containing protein, partial [Candidatus Thorarchaeota archaeon]
MCLSNNHLANKCREHRSRLCNGCTSVYNVALPEKVRIWHEGKCGRCGRRLTVPESIESGYGP